MNVTVKAPSTIAPGSPFMTRDGTTYTIGAGGLTVINAKYINDATAAGFSIPSAFTGTVTANVTANANGAQANGTALGYGFNQIATAGAANASVLLPAAVPGTFCTVVNDGANGVQVYGTGSDQINGANANVGVPQQASSEVTYSCIVAGAWRAIPATGFNGSYQTGLAKAGITANANGGQANGTAIAARFNRIATVGAANGSVQLPAAVAGMEITVTNGGANTANVYPQANESITGGAANAALQLAANKTARFSCANTGTWDAILTA